MTETLGEELEQLVGYLVKGGHFSDVLPQVETLNRKHRLGLPPEQVRDLQLNIIFKSYEIAISEEHLKKSGYTHLTPKDIEKACISGILEAGISSTYEKAVRLFKKGLEYQHVKRTTISSLYKD